MFVTCMKIYAIKNIPGDRQSAKTERKQESEAEKMKKKTTKQKNKTIKTLLIHKFTLALAIYLIISQ